MAHASGRSVRVRARARLATFLVSLAVLSSTSTRAEDKTVQVRAPHARPWTPRVRTGVTVHELAVTQAATHVDDSPSPGALSPAELRRLGLRPKDRALSDLTRWPEEPESPGSVDVTQFARALSLLCPPVMEAKAFEQLSSQVLEAARAFDADPLLLGALVYHQSGCDGSQRNAWGTGLTMLNRGLVPPTLRIGELRYWVRNAQGTWALRVKPFRPPIPLMPGALVDPASNLYTAAALLRMYEDQCASLDQVFGGAPHRHYVSHFIWGDQARGAGPEDGVLVARRRLIQYYTSTLPPPRVTLKGTAFGSPLDGSPRIVTSGLGEPREGGRRAHAGIDYLSRHGEPVRAVADGEVTRAGSDLLDGSLVDLDPLHAARMPERKMGVRGLFVEVAHAAGQRSVYAHLASYTVKKGYRVQRGALLGYVGRTGVRASDPHLHFGLFDGQHVIDPLIALAPYLFAPSLELRAERARPAARADPRHPSGSPSPVRAARSIAP
jgi:hypothetical protein